MTGVQTCALPIYGWCHSSNAWRSFRLEKVSDLRVLETMTSLPDEPFVEMPTVAVTIAVAQHRLELLEQFDVISTESVNEGVVLAEVAIAAPQWLARLCQAAGGDIRVVAPVSVREEVHMLIAAALDPYR